MMMKRLLLSGAALTLMVGTAAAQAPAATGTQTQTPPGATSPSGATTTAPAADAAAANSQANTEDPNLYSNIQGADVTDGQDASLGRVADLLIDTSGSLQQVILGHGGLVGIGETLRAYNSTELPKVADGKVKMGSMTKESLEQLPEYTYPEDRPAAGAATTGATGTTTTTTGTGTVASDAPAGTVAPGGNLPGATNLNANATAPTNAPASSTAAPRPAETMAETGTNGTAPPANDGTPVSTPSSTASSSATTEMGAMPVTGSTLWPASYLVGANITNAQDSAAINDLRFEGNRVVAVLIDKGSLGLGNDVTEVKFSDLAIAGTPKSPQITLKAANAGVPVDGTKAPAQ